MKTERCSINWGKGAVIVSLVALVIALFFFVAVAHFEVRMGSPVAVDWGSIVSRPCPAGLPNCKLAVDWGNSVSRPCPAGLPNCKLAVDWGSRPTPLCPRGMTNCTVAVDWGSRPSRF